MLFPLFLINDAMNICVQVFVWTCVSVFLAVYTETELLGHMVIMFSILKNCHTAEVILKRCFHFLLSVFHLKLK